MLIIHFPRSKTDQLGEGKGVSVHRFRGSYCPVNFLGKISMRFGDAVTSLPVEPSLFSRSAATTAMRRGLEKVGSLNAGAFTLHMGRHVGALAAVEAGCDMLTLKRQGFWKSDSCPQLYVDNHVMINADFTKFLSL